MKAVLRTLAVYTVAAAVGAVVVCALIVLWAFDCVPPREQERL